MFSARQPLPSLALATVVDQAPCGAEGSVSCTAGHLLHWLYGIAAVLAVVLLVVVALAIRLWRKNKDQDVD